MALAFFANFNNNVLLVTELIGTQAAPCILMLNGSLQSPAGVFVQNNTTIYWTNYFENTMYSGTLNGNIIINQRQLNGGIFQLPNGMSVNPGNDKIYWVNADEDVPADSADLVGSIYVADLSDIDISNPLLLNIPSDKLSAPNGLFIDYTQNPFRIYWTNFADNTMYVADLSDTAVSSIQALVTDGSPPQGPSGIFFDTPNGQLYWTNFNDNSVWVGYLNGTNISDAKFITGPNYNGPNGIFLINGSFSLDELIAGSCDPTCSNCIGLFMQFSDLTKTARPTLDLENSDDRQILSSALSLQSTYCFKIDWRNSSQLFGSAKSIQSVLNTSDSDLDPLLLDFKNAILSTQKEPDCCSSIPEV